MLKISSSTKSRLPDLDRKAFILIKIIWSVLAVITLSFIAAIVMQREYIFRYCLILFLCWMMSIVLLYVAKRGHAKFSAFAYVAFLLIMIFGFSWTGGGIKGHGMKILPMVVLFAGLTLGKKEIWFFGIAAIVGGFILALADYFQFLPTYEPIGHSPLIYWVYTTTSILLLCFLENISVEELRKALNESQKELELRKKSEALLKAKNEKMVEIAFLQSHIVRRPVANVLGLINLVNFNKPDDPVNLEVIPKIETAAKELDAIIDQIVRNTNEIENIAKAVLTESQLSDPTHRG